MFNQYKRTINQKVQVVIPLLMEEETKFHPFCFILVNLIQNPQFWTKLL